MEDNLNYIDLFNRYETHQLSEAEELDFETRLESDAVFKEEFEHYQLSAKLIFEAKLLALRNEVGNYHDSQSGKSGASPIWIGVIATVLISSATLYYFAKDSKQPAIAESVKTNKVFLKADTSSAVKQIKTVTGHQAISSPVLQQPETTAQKENTSSGESLIFKTDTVYSKTKVQEQSINNTPLAASKLKTTNPCDKVVISIEATAKSACSDHNDGSISIYNIEGGTKPYDIYINGNLHGKSPFIDHLGNGIYELIVHDKNACASVVKSIRVNSRICDISAVLKLSANEKWTMDGRTGDKVVITDKLDQIVYQNNQANAYEQFEWNGTNTQGNELAPGIYFIFIYKNDNLVQKGSITISY